jgi:ubiquinone/menaquinone biosynthesis C-methylase UbiE
MQAIELMVHKNPESTILQMGRVASEFTSSILSIVGAHSNSPQLFSQYTLIDRDPNEIEKAKELFQDGQKDMAFKVMDTNLVLEVSEYPNASVDIIIIPTIINTLTEWQELMSSVYRVSKPGGYLLASGSDSTDK